MLDRFPVFFWLRRLALLGIATAMAYVAIGAYLAVRHYPPDAPVSTFAAFRAWSPLKGAASAAETAPEALASDPQALDTRLRALAARYPLYPQLWLERARIAIRAESSPERVLALLAIATAIKPWGAETNWEAAMIALQVGETAAAERYLARYLTARPDEVGKVAFLAQRWLDAPELVDRVVPPGPGSLERLLRDAARWDQADLAGAAWERLPEPAKSDPQVIAPYVDYLLKTGDAERAVAIWRHVEPAYTAEAVANGSFAQPLRQHDALGWQVRPTAGVQIALDPQEHRSGPASLAITFDGEHNVHLASPSQRIPVEPGRRYRLSGHWRGEGLTTRSLPLLVVTDHPARQRLGKVPAPALDAWPWQPFALTFDVPDETKVITIAVRRYRTDAFDRFIAGALHIDDLALEPVPAEPELAARAFDARQAP